MKSKLLILLLVLLSSLTYAQDVNYSEKELSINQYINGTLLMTNNIDKPNLAILIAGSGPTDRNGNQNFLKNNALKKLAIGLANNNIATFRYDKRVVKQIREGNFDNNITFDDFVTDAKSVLEYFKQSNLFNKIYIIGHSQGSLVGMLAGGNGANGFVSLAGAGQPIDQVIMEQISKTAPMFIEDSKRVFDVLKTGNTTKDFPPALTSLFKLDVQPFIMNWMQYNPKDIIKQLDIPILIINGTKDIQVPEDEAKSLKDANPKANLVIIDKMNHILVPIEGDNLENTKSYNEPLRTLSKELIPTIVNFITNN